MKTNGRILATLAVGVAIGAGVSIPATALAQRHVVDGGGSMMGGGMGSMMTTMGGMRAEEGPTREDMRRMAYACAQMMDRAGMARTHDRMMDDSSGMNRMHDRMMGDM